jgi:ferric-dicitrate binding protein FerR (iron transport regulator)
MDEKYGPLLFVEERSSKQREALREQLRNDPELAEDWARWRRLRAQLREQFQERLPDRRLLVLYALEQEGRDELLTTEEQSALDATRDDIVAAIEAYPALQQIVERIQDERADFEDVWVQHRGEEATAANRRAQAEREERTSKRPARSRNVASDRRWAWRLTMGVLLVGAAVLAVFYGPRKMARETVTAQAGEQEVVEFGDGSTARLVGTTALSYTPNLATTERRRVSLTRGRAYFDVAQREEASFVVNTPSAQAKALGTQFGVTTGGDSTEGVLVEGTVQVSSNDTAAESPVALQSGERSTVHHGTPPTPPTSADLNAALDWTGLFVFRSTPMGAIAQRLSEHYDVSITVASSLADEPITGDFEREQPVSQILDTIVQTLGGELHFEDEAYRIEPAS